MKRLIYIFILFSMSCEDGKQKIEQDYPAESDTIEVDGQKEYKCDTLSISEPKIKDYRKALDVWLETKPLDWFLEHRQSVWREAKVWNKKIDTISNNYLIACLAKTSDELFMHIPNHFYEQSKGSSYIKFFIVNNSKDSIDIPALDATIDNFTSSVYANNDTSKHWVNFQNTDSFIFCGNSIWTLKLPPKYFIECEIESDYLYLGDIEYQYQLELKTEKLNLKSNSIPIKLMTKQEKWLGTKY